MGPFNSGKKSAICPICKFTLEYDGRDEFSFRHCPECQRIVPLSQELCLAYIERDQAAKSKKNRKNFGLLLIVASSVICSFNRWIGVISYIISTLLWINWYYSEDDYPKSYQVVINDLEKKCHRDQSGYPVLVDSINLK